MSVLAAQLIGEKEEIILPKKETRTYTVTSRPEYLDQIETLFGWINMTAGGHSGTAQISIDGDGAPRLHIEKEGGDLAEPETHYSSEDKVEFKVSMESLGGQARKASSIQIQR